MLRENNQNRLRFLSIFFLILALAIVAKLFELQVIQHEYYATLALSNHEMYQKIHAKRGAIYFQDSRTKEEYPAAVNRTYYQIYAVPRDIPDDLLATTTENLARILNLSDDDKSKLTQKLSKRDDLYEVVASKIDDDTLAQIQDQKFQGIYWVDQEFRYYPEDVLAAQVLGFYGMDKSGTQAGRYGVEGYWNDTLAGKTGFLLGEKGATGSWITMADHTSVDAVDGADLLLTIDRTLQYEACERLRQGLIEYKAKSASLVMEDPKTGAILAMCSLPDFDPNNYSKVDDISVYNNNTIFTPYEAGSVMKPIIMSIAVDLGLVKPDTTFTDPCERDIDGFKIHNALNGCYGLQTMTQILEKSINTGMIWVEEKIGQPAFQQYMNKFGFGQKIGIELDTETAGDISSLGKKGEIYDAVGSFGQGFTVTPLQLAMVYSGLANGGQMFRPHIVEEVRYANGQKQKIEPQLIDNIVSPRTAKIITGMLISVIENGSGYKKVKLDDYYVAGKTGTAQIPGQGGYLETTNHTFAGFAPANDPKFILVVKYEAPDQQWAESTAAPVFKDIVKTTLNYYGIPADK